MLKNFILRLLNKSFVDFVEKDSFPDLNKDGEVTYADVLEGRGAFAVGGSLLEEDMPVEENKMDEPMMDEPMMEEPMIDEPMMDEPEEEMIPDDEMEDEYLDFILDEALDSEEEDYLMSQLQGNEQLSEIFDKVIDVAQEFAGSGPVEGPGSGVSDSIPARLSDGEFVFTAKAVEEIGEDTLMSMMKEAEAAADERQGLAEGGMLEDNNVNVQADALLGMDMTPDPTQEAINENMIKYQPYVRS